jgi:anti-sigma factor RsiW
VSIPESHLAQEAIAALVDGELSGGAAGRAARHLAGCLQCRLAVSAQREAKAALQVPEDVAVPGDLMSRLRAIPFTADMPSDGPMGSLGVSGEALTSTGPRGAFSFPLAAPAAPAPRPGQARWLRRGMTGALVGIGVGVAVLAVSLPSSALPVDDAPGPAVNAVRHTVPQHERTDIVPPVVRTRTVGSTASLPSGGTP